jgi:FkbM family methyltransferase
MGKDFRQTRTSISDMNIYFEKKYGLQIAWQRLSHYFAERRFARLSKRHLLDSPQVIGFAFDYISLQIASYGSYDRQELETFLQWIDERSAGKIKAATALDVGANIGNHSLWFSKYFKQVHAFEPNPRTFKVLSLNAELAENISCHQVGLGDRPRVAHFQSTSSNIGSSRVIASPSADSFTVKIETLDNVAGGIPNIGLIKIDVEGLEHEVFLGAAEVIKKHRPVILFEQFNHKLDGTEGGSIKLLKSYGYREFAVIRRGPRAPDAWPRLIRTAWAILARLTVGERMRIERIDHFREQFYPLIVALPSDTKV